MIAALLAACLFAPLYLEIGSCDLAVGPCHCTDLEWDASAGATSYEIARETVSAGVWQPMGTVSQSCDEADNCSLATAWPLARDASVPHASVQYRYRVRACNAAGCGAWSATADNRAWPYACFEDDREVACYVGDPIVTR